MALSSEHRSPVPALDDALVARMLAVAVAEARHGLADGGIPIGAALFHEDGTLLGRGHNRRVQDGDPSMHAETAAFRAAGRRRHYADCVMVTTLSPCWYCSGLLRQFGIGTVVIGEARNFEGGHAWVAEHGRRVVLLDDAECIELLGAFIAANPEVWHEDIGL
jgi:cytosine/creatinine deaminase